MIKNPILFIIDNNGDYLRYGGTLRAINGYREFAFVISPRPLTDSVSMSIMTNNANYNRFEQYVLPTAIKVNELIEESDALYQTIADWNVFGVEIKPTALADISNFRSGATTFSFQFQTPQPSTKCVTYKGVFGVDNPLPTTGRVTGDYYECEDWNFYLTSGTQTYTFTKGMYVYFNGSRWIKDALLVELNTSTVSISVEPSHAVGYEIDDDDANYLASIGAAAILAQQTAEQSAQDVEDLKDGTTIVKKAEQDKNGNDIVTTYETKSDATSKLALKADKTYVDSEIDVIEDALASKEVVENKATDFTTVNDTKYPSTKAVKNYVDVNFTPKTRTIIGLNLQDDILIDEFRTALGNATQSVAGLLSAEDKTHLDGLVALLENSDGDTIVDTIAEILAIFQNYPEGADLVTVLQGKVDKVVGKSLVDADEITKLEGLDNQTTLDGKFALKVDKTRTIAGIDLQNNITKEELKIALDLDNPIPDGSITPEKTTFITISTNLFNKNTIIDGQSIPSGQGELSPSVDNNVSDWIKATPNQNYTIVGVARIVFYNESKQYLSHSSGDSATIYTRVAPINTAYIRLVVHDTFIDTCQMNIGDTLLPYEPYGVTLDPSIKVDNYILKTEKGEPLGVATLGADGKVPSEQLPDIPTKISDLTNDSDFQTESEVEAKLANMAGGYIPNGTITPEKTSFILSTSTNKFNKSTVLSGHVIPSKSGTPTANAGYSVSDFIEVSPSQIITVYGATRITVFDIAKSYLAHFTISASTSNTRTMPSGAKYVRLSVDNNLFDECQMNIGDTLLPYEPYSLTLDPSIRVTGIDEEPKEIDLWVEDRYVIEGEVRGNITGQTISALPTWASYTTSDIISLYDNLMSANPNYISKSILGTDSLGENIYRYDFKPTPVPTEYVNNDELKTKFPKMILIAGIHGSEKAGVYNLFQALKQITENWGGDELLETLRWNCHFIVVPIVSNYGYNNTQRKNENGVDLARNFPERWKLTNPSDSTYGGPSPLSENGSQLIAQLLQDNKEDTIYFTSHHNFGGGTNNFIWNASATKLQVHLGRQLVSKMTRKWKKQYTWMPQDEVTYVGYADNNAPSGSEAVYAASLGIQASTFEVSHEMPFESSPQMYNSIALTLGAETLLNWLLINLKNNVDFYNSLK